VTETQTEQQEVLEVNYSATARWIMIMTSTLLSLLIGVFLVGWNARGQTAAITALEVKTVGMQQSFNTHCAEQRLETKEVRDTLTSLKLAGTKQTVLLQNIDKHLSNGLKRNMSRD